MSLDDSAAPAGGVAAAEEPPPAEPPSQAVVAARPETGLREVRASGEAPRGSEASEAVPEWAGAAPSVGLAAGLKGASGRGRRNLLLAAGGVGVLVLAAVGIAVFAGGGKKHRGPDQKQTPVVVGSEKAAASARLATVEKPALPAAAVEPATPQPAAQEKPEALAKDKLAPPIAAPAEKPAQPEKPVPAPAPAEEKPKPAEKRIAAEKPAPAERPIARKPAAAPKPAAEKPVADKPLREPAVSRPEKKQAAPPGAQPATDKAQEATAAYQRGNAKLLGGAPGEAIAAFSEALKLNPKDAQSRRGLGLAYAQAGNAAQAVRHLKLYLKASPNAPDRPLIQKRIDQLGGH